MKYQLQPLIGKYWGVTDAHTGTLLQRCASYEDAMKVVKRLTRQAETEDRMNHTPEEQEHAELEPTHAPTCDCDACEQTYADAQGNDDFTTNPVITWQDMLGPIEESDLMRNRNAGDLADARSCSASRTHGHLREQLRAAAKVFALALACLMPGHADARDLPLVPTDGECAITRTFEDGSATALCGHDVWAYDADGGFIYDNGVRFYYRAPGTWYTR